MTKRKGTPMGRGSIFRPKINDREHRYQMFMTEVGREEFEAARERLATNARIYLGRWAPASISDADTAEYLVRGFQNSKRYMQAMRKELDAK